MHETSIHVFTIDIFYYCNFNVRGFAISAIVGINRIFHVNGSVKL
jgi:hypothetical protein